MDNKKRSKQTSQKDGEQELAFVVPESLARAYQRCAWVIINETGRTQKSIMEEVVKDFLIKHGC